MALNIWNLEFLNHNSQRAYPLADWASKSCADASSIKLPNDFILALSLAVGVGMNINIENFYVKSVMVVSTGCTIVIGYYNGDDNPEVATTFIPANQEQTTFTLTGLGDFADIIGYIAVDTRSSIMTNLSGYFNFNYEATALEPDCIRPMLKGLSAIQVNNQGSLSARLTGDIILKAGTNIDISVAGNMITVSAVNNEGFEDDCVCHENANKPCITSINGVTANDAGNITLVGTNCLQLTSGSHAISMADTCAEPCCGCEELNALYDNYKSILDGSKTLSDFVNTLDAKIDQVSISFAGANSHICSCAPQPAAEPDTQPEE